MTQYNFDLLLKKYLSGECNEEEEKLIIEWSNELLQTNLPMNSEEKESLKKRIWTKIQQNVLFGKEMTASPSGFLQIWSRIGMAASVILVAAIGAYFYLNRSENINSQAKTARVYPPKGVIEITNSSEKEHEIKLEDGSLVVLKEKSSIRYPEHFNNTNRDVYLKGEAFFKVKRNPSKPFIVHTGEIITEVLGTSFSVKSYDEASSIEVSVVSGRVSVYEKNERTIMTNQKNMNGVILTPNQKIVFEKATKKMIPTIIENPIVIHPPETRLSFVFEDTPLPEVLEKLKKAYAIEILVQNPAMNKCIFTADLNELSLYKQLDLICKSVNSTYEQRGTSIFINGEGCN